MLWDIEIKPAPHQPDREGRRLLGEAQSLGLNSLRDIRTAKSFLVEGDLDAAEIERAARTLLVDQVVEVFSTHALNGNTTQVTSDKGGNKLIHILFKPGVTDNVAQSTLQALQGHDLHADRVATCRRYWFNADANPDELRRFGEKVLSNAAIELIVEGPLHLDSLSIGHPYAFVLNTIPLLSMNTDELVKLSREGQLALQKDEMLAIQAYFREQGREPTDIELETIAQTWSEHCSHKTLAGRIRYREDDRETLFTNMLKETVFAATMTLREQAGADDWCVSVFRDNAGVVKFNDDFDVCMKVETHNHPSAIEPYGGANTGLGGVIRDPLGTGLGAKPVCNTDVFCFAPPTMSANELPPGVLHPKAVLSGVVAGVRDYGNRMGIPTVNGSIFFDERYLGNPLVYCGNVAMIPVGKSQKQANPGDYIVSVGGRTGRDGIHGATFSSIELTHESEEISGGSVQIGNAITEKMVLDAVLTARDLGLYSAITDCGAGGFSSAVGEMGEETGAEVWLEKAPLKYDGLSYTEIWISEAQERMILAVPPHQWDKLHQVCADEGVEATIIGQFTDTKRLVLKYDSHQVGDVSMAFLHDGRPKTVRDAVYRIPAERPLTKPTSKIGSYESDLKKILGSGNVCSKEWVIRQYDHEVQAGSVVKPLVGVNDDGPSDAAVVQPLLNSKRGLVISNGMNPKFGDLDPYWMAASAIDEAIRNCVAVGADPQCIAILDNFCWGNTDRPETLGSLVRAALACRDFAVAYRTPFISGKDSLNNEFTYIDAEGKKQTVAIPASLLISALGQIENVASAVTMDFKEPGNLIYLVGTTYDELGGSHWADIQGVIGGTVPRVRPESAMLLYRQIHELIKAGLVRSCHDLSEGGLAVSLAESAFAGGYGATCDLGTVPTEGDLDDISRLFSESNSRLILEIKPEDPQRVDEMLSNIPHAAIGVVSDKPRLTVLGLNEQIIIDQAIDDLKTAWQKPLTWE
ncbi:MAG: phosphoribosylformylglycinamidine synthase subunit PurL [Planctomycetota bacterium]|nr:phosphoribosylformylglycinamidine synthase subunit PurL [Planctomycetota bacterium]MDA1212293.1 phosphoribosylformylglycinamidine synthase subunit PurL [Planctomycetota bacterium]